MALANSLEAIFFFFFSDLRKRLYVADYLNFPERVWRHAWQAYVSVDLTRFYLGTWLTSISDGIASVEMLCQRLTRDQNLVYGGKDIFYEKKKVLINYKLYYFCE